MKNTIVMYNGGSYNGCLYEPNVSIFDSQGEYHPIICTGRRGRKDKETFDQNATIKDKTFPLTTAGMLTLQSQLRHDFYFQVMRHIDDSCAIDPVLAVFKCAVCGEVQDISCFSLIFLNEYGDGGIGLIRNDMLCLSCFDANSCDECGGYHYYDGDKNEKTGNHFDCDIAEKERQIDVYKNDMVALIKKRDYNNAKRLNDLILLCVKDIIAIEDAASSGDYENNFLDADERLEIESRYLTIN